MDIPAKKASNNPNQNTLTKCLAFSSKFQLTNEASYLKCYFTSEYIYLLWLCQMSVCHTEEMPAFSSL